MLPKPVLRRSCGYSFLLLVVTIGASGPVISEAPRSGSDVLTATERDEADRLDKIRHDAYDYAVACLNGKTPAVRFEDIEWVIYPSETLRLRDEYNRPIAAEGYWNAKDSTIWIVRRLANHHWTNAHEVMHAVLGINGHPPEPFRRCHLMADQQHP
jgi:hypothetical protein